MPVELKQALEEFARFARSLKGDEKSEAQAFLERFFRAFGHLGVIEAGATFEFRISKKPGTAQLELLKDDAAKRSTGKKFADLLCRQPLMKSSFRPTASERQVKIPVGSGKTIRPTSFLYWRL